MEDDEGWGRHAGAPDQQGDTWDVDWSHVCDEWCANPCEWQVYVDGGTESFRGECPMCGCPRITFGVPAEGVCECECHDPIAGQEEENS